MFKFPFIIRFILGIFSFTFFLTNCQDDESNRLVTIIKKDTITINTRDTLIVKDSSSFNHLLGEQFGGGVVFQLWRGEDGAEHGLVVDVHNLDTMEWGDKRDTFLGAKSYWDGQSNTSKIVDSGAFTKGAVLDCYNSTNGGFNDWYMPAVQELVLLVNNLYYVNKTLEVLNGDIIVIDSGQGNPLYPYYWTSTEINSIQAMGYSLGRDEFIGRTKHAYCCHLTRAIRAF